MYNWEIWLAHNLCTVAPLLNNEVLGTWFCAWPKKVFLCRPVLRSSSLSLGHFVTLGCCLPTGNAVIQVVLREKTNLPPKITIYQASKHLNIHFTHSPKLMLAILIPTDPLHTLVTLVEVRCLMDTRYNNREFRELSQILPSKSMVCKQTMPIKNMCMLVYTHAAKKDGRGTLAGKQGYNSRDSEREFKICAAEKLLLVKCAVPGQLVRKSLT